MHLESIVVIVCNCFVADIDVYCCIAIVLTLNSIISDFLLMLLYDLKEGVSMFLLGG